MMNKTENQPNDNQLQLELCVARMEACVVRNELFEATSQLLKYQSQENKQLYENLRQIHAELAPKAGGAPGGRRHRRAKSGSLTRCGNLLVSRP
ncbi:hypothetical protein [Pluralibacter gergoviae]|uniref:hypothetical protein n=1 Tax=Pluralibacter gergoviae TaxID=61647 RepID=UPI000AD70EA2|nr:hypothetical protein [Pluralibacter gergoviae]